MRRLPVPTLVLALAVGALAVPVAATAGAPGHIDLPRPVPVVRAVAERFDTPGSPEVDIHRPVVSGAFGAAKINAVLESWADGHRRDFTGRLPDEDTAPVGLPRSSLTLTFEVTLATPRLLDLDLVNEEYYGGVHPVAFRVPALFDAITGRRLAFGDLFRDRKAEAAARKVIAKAVAAYFKAGEAAAGVITPFEKLKAEPDFYLAPGRLVIYFQQYEHTCYAAGFPEVAVPLAKLAKFLNPELELR